MGTDCVDICDLLVEQMCFRCPKYKKCQNAEDEANHEQMAICMGSLKMTEYPEDFEPIYPNCCVCGKPAEGNEDVCECTCPTCGQPCFDDSEFGDHHECRDCHKARLNGEIADEDEKEDEDKAQARCPYCKSLYTIKDGHSCAEGRSGLGGIIGGPKK